jgi:Sap-like sulfolipid-1-addressing protein
LAARQWQGRPKPGEEAAMPKWMQAIDGFSAVKSLGLGVLLAGANPKNLALTGAAAAVSAQAGISGSREAVSLVVFVLLGSLTILVPLGSTSC